ncbi:MAG: gamma-glutamyltransferase [Pseudohongiellaceae bacterium]
MAKMVFYRGENAKRLADFMAANGGLITEEDLEQYEAIERETDQRLLQRFSILLVCHHRVLGALPWSRC